MGHWWTRASRGWSSGTWSLHLGGTMHLQRACLTSIWWAPSEVPCFSGPAIAGPEGTQPAYASGWPSQGQSNDPDRVHERCNGPAGGPPDPKIAGVPHGGPWLCEPHDLEQGGPSREETGERGRMGPLTRGQRQRTWSCEEAWRCLVLTWQAP
ncbi:hypothetical protein NDU88_004985 [Pleurodeles waltl]|uniref:Uncharacterized protein n=1 Tax=Pleurodeles waltl TaxID=8319 RepID=A0AAV7WAL3_PLEWA|nr:hypothetical protein NDU88_004985 [Pleurodeles waltl]